DLSPVVPVAAAPPSVRESPLFLDALIREAPSPAVANQQVRRQLGLLGQLVTELASAARLSERFPDRVPSALAPKALKQLDALALDYLTAGRLVWLEQEEGDLPLAAVITARGASGESDAGRAVCGEWYRSQSIPVQAARRLEDLYARAFTTLV